MPTALHTTTIQTFTAEIGGTELPYVQASCSCEWAGMGWHSADDEAWATAQAQEEIDEHEGKVG